MDSLEESIRNYNESKLNEEKNELAKNSDRIGRFKVLCSEKGLRLSDENFRYIYTIGIIASIQTFCQFSIPKLNLIKKTLLISLY